MDWRLTEMDLEMDTLKRTTMTTKKDHLEEHLPLSALTNEEYAKYATYIDIHSLVHTIF